MSAGRKSRGKRSFCVGYGRRFGVRDFVRKDVDFLESMSAVIASLRTQAGSALVL